MTLKCRHCGAVIKRDAREVIFKMFMTKRGYRSYCEKINKITFLKKVF